MATFIQVRLKIKIIACFIFYFTFLIHSATAQGFKNFIRENEFGFEGSFGIKSFLISSNISEINNLNVVTEGGSVGIVLGSKSLVMRLKQGYYYSASSVVHSIDEVRSCGMINFYPGYFINKKAAFRPYLIVGMERNTFKMYGYYNQDQDLSKKNYSVVEAPSLGRIFTILTSFGGGIEHRLVRPGCFISFFGEARYGNAIKIDSSNDLFSKTTQSGQLIANVGIRFGSHR